MATFIEGSLLQVPDELILVNNEYYAVYNYETTGGSIMPLVVDIDLPESAILKNQMMMLDIVANNDWERPIYFTGGSYSDSEYLWMKKYLQL